jgi:hypothetical protein
MRKTISIDASVVLTVNHLYCFEDVFSFLLDYRPYSRILMMFHIIKLSMTSFNLLSRISMQTTLERNTNLFHVKVSSPLLGLKRTSPL